PLMPFPCKTGRINGRHQVSYCITLRSRADRRITGWYDGSTSRWSTDFGWQRIFERKRDAKSACHELRKLSPSNADLISIEPHNFGSGVRGSASFEPRAD